MNSANQPLEAYLRERGYSATRPRKFVFEALEKLERTSMHELVESCTTVDRASVYRTIKLFERIGVVQKIYTGWKYQIELGEAFQEHHHHALCTRCNKHIDLPEHDELERLIELLARQKKFKLKQHTLELRGICAGCQATKNIST